MHPRPAHPGAGTVKVLAVDLGGSHAACAVVEDQRVCAVERVPLAPRGDLGAALPRIAEALREAAGTNLDACQGLALGFCGLADIRTGRVLSTNGKYDDAPAIDLPDWCRRTFGLPFRIENDARMALLGERYAGAARGFDDVVMLTFGTGVGGAAMIGGRLLRGKHAQAGCLGGHFVVRHQGRTCTCGNSGCVEAEASTWALPAICADHPKFAESALAELSTPIGFAEVIHFADAGDACARDVLAHCLEVWSAGIVSLIHAYDPEIVVAGGAVMKAAARLLPSISEQVHRHAWTPWGRVAMRAAELGDRAALLGAVPLFQEALA